ncbi:MAG: hypothetical protein IPI11_13620 [Haliscomenobacter sp.]|nr:hypothetical protein [Haliscomenobacter sp.]
MLGRFFPKIPRVQFDLGKGQDALLRMIFCISLLSKQTQAWPTHPFNDPFFFIFNVAVGVLAGPPDGNTPFPQRMFVIM